MNRLFNPSWSKDRRRELRQEETAEEKRLWSFLRAGKLEGNKFRRQCGIGPYIADFCCTGARLVIELDGGIHKQTVEYDHERDAYLIGAGYRVIRFSNEQVRDNVDAVLAVVRSEINSSKISLLTDQDPSFNPPLKGEGSI